MGQRKTLGRAPGIDQGLKNEQEEKLRHFIRRVRENLEKEVRL